MAALAETDVAAVELEHVEPALPDLFEVEDTFFGAIEKKPTKVVSNREMRVPMKMWPGGSPGSFDPDGGSLGLGTGPKYQYAAISPVHTKHAIQWNLKADWATDERRKAIVQAVRETVSEAMAEYRRFLDCCIVGGAGNGILATISSAANNSPTGYDRYTCDSEFGVRLLRYGHYVTIYQTGLSAVRHADVTEIQIVNIDYPNKTFDTATVTNLGQATDEVVHSGLSGATPTSFKGVGYHASSASTGTWLGLNRATYPQIRANSVNAAGGLALSHARLALNKVGERLGIGKGRKMVAWMHPCQIHAYEELGQLVQVVNRGGGSSQGLDLYFDVAQIAGAQIKPHFSWSKKRIDFMDMSVWGRAEMSPIKWFTTEGRRIYNTYAANASTHLTSGVTTSFISYLTSSFNTYVDNPGLLSYIYGLTVPTGY